MIKRTAMVSGTDWRGIAVFTLIAYAWSFFAARHLLLVWPLAGAAPRFDDSIVMGLGPALGGLAAMVLRPGRGHGFGSFAGFAPRLAAMAIAAPALSLAVFGLNRAGWNPQLNGLIFGLSVTIYSLGEELGWRGWLRRALTAESTRVRVAVTFALWFGWHWTFLAVQLLNPVFALQFAAGIALASYGLELAARRSGGLAVPTAWHAAAKATAWPLQIAAMLAMIGWAAYRSRQDQPAAAAAPAKSV